VIVAARLACCVILALAAPPWVQQVAVPADLEIILASSPRSSPDGEGAEAVEILASGAVVFSTKETADGILPLEEAVLPPQAIAQIWAAIQEQRFFDLDDTYTDPEVSGGDQATLYVTANGVAHGVTTVNIGVDAFDAIVWAINDHLPDERQVIYNALHVEGYKRVAR